MNAGHPLRRALPLVLLAGFFFSSLDSTAKYLVLDHPLFAVVWARYAGQMVVTTPIAWHRGGPGFWRTKHLGVQLARSFCLVIATTCFVAALRFLPLAEGTAIAFLAPMFAIALSHPVLGEMPTRERFWSAFAGFVGIVLIVRPGSAVFQPATALLVLAAIANAFYQLLTRKVPNDTPHTTLFYSALVGTVMLSAALPFVDRPATFTLRDGFFFVLMGLLAGLGHGFLTGAFLRAPATLVAPFTYLQMIWSTAYGWLLFGHLPDALSALGMAVIVASGVALVLHERRRR
jgi:drug/metabolite transporter (DMT)-like permease